MVFHWSTSAAFQGMNRGIDVVVRGLVKLKKSKNPRITRISQTTPTHPIIQFFLETF